MNGYIMETDAETKRRFAEACDAAAEAGRKAAAGSSAGIGTLGEKGVHRALKYFYEPDESCHEIKVGEYYADIVGENGIIEIQSAGFGSMKKKLAEFLLCSRVTVVYPCSVSKRIVMTDPVTGEILYRRKSPKNGGIYDLLRELWGIADLLGNERLEIRAVFIETEEMRVRRGPAASGRRKKKKNYAVAEKIPTGIVGELVIRGREDYRAFLPEGLPEKFTTADMRRLTGLDSMGSCSAVNLLCRMTVIERCGKSGRSYIYRRI